MRKLLSFLRDKDLVEQFVVASRIGGGIVPRLAQDLSNHVAGTTTNAEAARRLGLALVPSTAKWVEDGIKKLDTLEAAMRHKANIAELERIIEAKEIPSFKALKEYHLEEIKGRYPQYNETQIPVRSHDTHLNNNDQAMLRLIDRGESALDLMDPTPTPTPTQPKWMQKLEQQKDRAINQGASISVEEAP